MCIHLCEFPHVVHCCVCLNSLNVLCVFYLLCVSSCICSIFVSFFIVFIVYVFGVLCVRASTISSCVASFFVLCSFLYLQKMCLCMRVCILFMNLVCFFMLLICVYVLIQLHVFLHGLHVLCCLSCVCVSSFSEFAVCCLRFLHVLRVLNLYVFLRVCRFLFVCICVCFFVSLS